MNTKRGRLRMMEEGLASQIAEFRSNFGDLELDALAKSGSSLGDLKSAEQYSKDRECTLQSLLTIPRPPPLHCQFSVMQEELELCLKPTFTVKNLPILLNQFYTERLQELIQLKHMMLLRWTRLAIGRPKVVEELGTEYSKRIEYIMLEYNNTLNRSRHLSTLCSKNIMSDAVMDAQDILPFLRWLVYHQHTTKKATAFTSCLQWFPLYYELELVKALQHVGKDKLTEGEQRIPQHKSAETAKKWLSSQHSFSSQLAPGLDRGEKGVESQLLFPPTVASSLGEGLPEKLGEKMGVGSVSMPLHQTDVTKNQALLQELMLNYNIAGPVNFPSMAEELQFYYQVMRKFQSLFQTQETEATYYTYDKIPEGEGHAKLSKSKLTFTKPSNWVPFVRVHATPDPVQVKAFAKLKQAVPDIDPLLSLNSKCTHLHNLQRVLYALKQHSVVVRHPSSFTALSVTSHKTPHDSLLVWKCIYSGLDSRNPLHSGDPAAQEGGLAESASDEEVGVAVDMGLDMSLDMPGALKVILNRGGRRVSAKARQVSKDAYLGFLFLRHLRIRDLRQKCLQMLNYCRSVERTLTINAEGLSLEHNLDQKSKKTSGLLDHSYLFRTPMDYKIDQSDFMRFMEVENHDDYYSFDTDGSVQVWDQRGVAVMYDITHEDLNSLENELLMVASYYMRRVALQESHKKLHVVKSQEDEEEEIEHFAQQSVDRFAILLDLWSCESRYLQAKVKVCNCYLEAYQHTLNPTQRTNLHLAMVTVMKARPRYDPEALYFTEQYSKEIRCLEQLSDLLLSVINYQMSEERVYNELVCNWSPDLECDSARLPYGLPLPFLPQHVVSLTGDKHLQIKSYLFEFSESLCVLGNLPQAFQWALTEACTSLNAESPRAVVSLHLKLLEMATSEWVLSPEIGTSHSNEVQRQILCDDTAESPSIMADVFLSHGNRISLKSSSINVTPVEQKINLTKAWIDVLQLISLRHHLLHTLLENEFLTRLYKHQLLPLDFEDCHAHLRCICFDHSLRFPHEKSLDDFIAQAREEVKGGNPRLDHYSPSKLKLAVHELDEKVGSFSFGTKKDILKILSGGSNPGMECVKTSLQVEVVNRNCLVMASQQNGLIIRCSDKSRSIHRPDYFSSSARSAGRSSQTSALTPTSTPPPMIPGLRPSPLSRRNALVEKKLVVTTDHKLHFVSIQQEKAPIRDHMLAQFTKQPTSISRDPEQLDRCKCSLISAYTSSLHLAFSVHSLRIQTIRYYQNLSYILDSFPATREAHFILGETKNQDSGTKYNFGMPYAGMDPAGRLLAADMHKSKPHQLLSRDGKVLLNLFYLPHYTEILFMFEEIPIQERCDQMMVVMGLAASLCQLMQYICAYVQLSGGLDKSNDFAYEKKEFGGFWGGTESIGAELIQVQAEIGRLNDPCNPRQVIDFLQQRCHVMFYNHDIVVRHYLRQSLLSIKNYKQLQVLDSVSIPSCHQLSATVFNPYLTIHTHNAHYPHYGPLPHPYDTYHYKAPSVMPWRAFLHHHGLFPASLSHTSQIGSHVYVSLACLDPEGLSLAHGEFVGMSLVQEDILQASHFSNAESPTDNGPQPQLQIPATTTTTHSATKRSAGSQKTEQQQQHACPSRPSSGALSSSLSNHNSNQEPFVRLNIPPVECSNILEKFLIVTSQLEQLKIEWGLKVLNCHTINTKRLVKDLEAIYKERIMRVSKKIVAKIQMRDLARKHAEEEVNDLTSEVTLMSEASADTSGAGGDVLEPTGPLDEFKLRETQLKSLMDNLEQVMISETSKYLSKLYHLMLNERERDDSILPLDLWKSNAMNFKELTGISRSHVVEDFVSKLQPLLSIEERVEEGVTRTMVTVPLAELKEYVHELSSGLLAREKECYQLYASYYEALLRSQYNQLYQKNREVEHYKTLAETKVSRNREEVLCFMGEHTHQLILEITALRGRLDQIQHSMHRKLEACQRRATAEYMSLVDELFSSSLSIKNKFEEYRGDLYEDMTQHLSDVRKSVMENMQKLKEKLGVKEEAESATPTGGEEAGGTKLIQDENAELTKQFLKLRADNNWERHKAGVIHNTELFSLQNKLDAAQMEYLALKMSSQEEIISLRQQVQVMQKQLGRVERECEITKQSLKEEKLKQSASGKSAAKNQESFLSKTEKTYAAKLDRLTQELEDKEKQLKAMQDERERSRKHADFERGQVSKVVHGIKQQLSHERSLKLDAFHQVDHLVQQVQQFEDQPTRSTVYWASPQSVASSSMRMPPPPTPGLPFTLGLQSVSHSRLCRSRANQRGGPQEQPQTRPPTRLSSNSERRIDVGQEIIALKLI